MQSHKYTPNKEDDAVSELTTTHLTDYMFVPIQRDTQISHSFVASPHSNNIKFERLDDKEQIPLFLRYRSMLAYLYFNNLLVQHEPYAGQSEQVRKTCSNGVLWAPNLKQDAITDAYTTYAEVATPRLLQSSASRYTIVGGALICTDRTASWRDQFPGVFLHHGLEPKDLINALTPAMQWLRDRPQAMRTLHTLWGTTASSDNTRE